ncbi:hypothetical protein EIC82_03835 [Enterobacter sp. A11]|uniref:hypothetical protein n=1 Tax=unclassified Enterobacter TaxID=2608935 RepID=UPI00106FA07B|nr:MULTISPECIES: hypothetical protein [unclassified Enterobacter]MBM1020222.1 hypothetical protein [Enterobacter sp. E1]MEA3561523.1 hypothetical protein [Enterobacter sp. GM-22]MEA3595181.1 hypothetical protein [Enterobacter sp. GM-31]TFF60319.1 hypothetical protein EIC82_03835 [Enterobacter sp. A11]
MHWTIPEPYTVPFVKPLRWSGWWRGFSLCVMTLLLVGCGGYFWLKDPRLLLYTFGCVVLLILVFAGIAGWNMYRYGVEAEHAEDISNLNRLTTLKWQDWAQRSVAVLGFHAFFPSAVLSPLNSDGPVNGDKPLLLPSFTGFNALFHDLLLPLLPELQQLVAAGVPVEVSLPEGCDKDEWQQFSGAWQTLGLPVSLLLPSLTVLNSYARQINRWLASPSVAAQLVIIHHRDAQQATTEGAVIWLLAPKVGQVSGLPVHCSLHRPMHTSPPAEPAAFRRFLGYQPLTTGMNGLWTDAVTREQADVLLIAHSQRPQPDDSDTGMDEKNSATPAPLPEQHYLPHWLGKSGPYHDWFTVTLMMQMALAKPGVQCAMIHDGDAVLLSSVSTGAFSND